MNDHTSTKFSDTSTAPALPTMMPTARASSSYSSTVNNGNNAPRDALSRSSTVQTQQATAASMLLTATLLATAKMAPTPALAATSLPSSMSPLTMMPPTSTITLAPTIVSMAYEAMAPFLDEIKTDLVPRSNENGRCVTEDASTTQRIPTEIQHAPFARTLKTVKAAELFANNSHLMDEESESDTHTEQQNMRKPFKARADKSLVIVKQEADEIVPQKASGPSALDMSLVKKEHSSGLGARNLSPRKERYEEPGLRGPWCLQNV